MIAQPSLFGARADRRKPSKKWVQALHLRPVADVVDPEHGGEEIGPCPSAAWTGRREHPVHDALRLPWWRSSVATEPEAA